MTIQYVLMVLFTIVGIEALLHILIYAVTGHGGLNEGFLEPYRFIAQVVRRNRAIREERRNGVL